MAEAIKHKGVTVDLEKANEWLDRYWTGDRICPICGNSNWSGNDKAMEVRSFDEGRLTASGPVIPFLTIACSICGHTLFFNALIAGLVERPENQ